MRLKAAKRPGRPAILQMPADVEQAWDARPRPRPAAPRAHRVHRRPCRRRRRSRWDGRTSCRCCPARTARPEIGRGGVDSDPNRAGRRRSRCWHRPNPRSRSRPRVHGLSLPRQKKPTGRSPVAACMTSMQRSRSSSLLGGVEVVVRRGVASRQPWQAASCPANHDRWRAISGDAFDRTTAHVERRSGNCDGASEVELRQMPARMP